MRTHVLKTLSVTFVAASLVGCSGMNYSTPTPMTPITTPTSVISQLATATTIGSTVDVGTGNGVGDTNPYGLAIAPASVTGGIISPGDLVVCNFNSSSTMGMGTTIEDLKPTAGSKPVRVAQDPSLQGCDALAFNDAKGAIWAAAYTANDNPIISDTGTILSTLAPVAASGSTPASGYAWKQPWGQIYASPTNGAAGTAAPTAFYVTDANVSAGTGDLIQANITANGIVYNKIVTGFPSSVSATYGILAPAGPTYDPTTDDLYVISSDTNSILLFTKVSTIPAGGVTIKFTAGASSGGAYPTTTAGAFVFSGPNASQASVYYSGSPLNYPVSSALLYNGDLIVGNTGDNKMVEFAAPAAIGGAATMVGTKQVDTGAAGAIFGIATSGTSVATQKIYFNDDNTATVNLISQ